ncbi:cell division protein FtsW [Actinoplanes sp. NBRC 14428]|uniref:Cell elongation-specific peptidoglycan biosynthesis regulator RodA n=2 Tax=Pseudosporangium ferrugineum TaxID=439699 RepID=A0A2T0S158_9ACTN|nr:FtsW/RodA/SpoVE family cell cycle protein [Pseudosporangium ferrugineum]PRY27140.1 cell elongation-specific peptidoglycan biosynthesis regulator RodA [Pseudosporangium ferrugineum]BCJ53188.1 cell division protein FtsW [Actinoplanes sp. NBRC 14428]
MPRVPGTRTGRNAELGLLLFAMVIVALFGATAEINQLDKLSSSFWVPAALLTVLFVGLHLVVRFRAVYADPVLIPAVALINGLGVAFLRRMDLERAIARKEPIPGIFGAVGGRQLMWTLFALILAALLLVIVRDHKTVSRYAYTLGLVGIVLVMIPAVLPASISEVNGARLWIRIGSFSIQPGEFAKLALVSFFAYYLVRKREVLSLASRRFLGIDFPRGRDLGPVVTVWLLSLLVLVFEKDLGTALLYFGLFVVTLYVATERASWLIIGLLMFFGGVYVAYLLGASVGGPFANFYDRASVWLDPFADKFYNREFGGSYQLVQGLLGLGTGGLFGSGPGGGSPWIVPEVRTDFIFAGLGEEIGLFGLSALLVCYLLIVERGLRAALAVRDSFGKLVAGGLAFTLGLQVFVILGGITGLIPLTGQTTPFLSAGGSSLMANWLLVAMLLRISDAGRKPATGGPAVQAGGPKQPPAQLHGAMTEVIKP